MIENIVATLAIFAVGVAAGALLSWGLISAQRNRIANLLTLIDKRDAEIAAIRGIR